MITADNFLYSCLVFEDRQAGVSTIYCHDSGEFFYHAYCFETKIHKDLMSCEFDSVEEACGYINDEFSSWQLTTLTEDKSGCGSCHAK